MSWVQMVVLGVGVAIFNAGYIEWGLWRRQKEIRLLLGVRGSVDSALTANASRIEQVAGEVKDLRGRVEVVERELKLR